MRKPPVCIYPPPCPSDGLCECGCGEPTRIAPRTHAHKGWVKGQPLRFVLGHNARGRKVSEEVRARLLHYATSPEVRAASGRTVSGERSHWWKGGRRLDSSGYVLILLAKDHPLYCMADTKGYVLEHRLVMALHVGRPLEHAEIVHHRNEVKADNSIENLQLCANHSEHMRIHFGDEWGRPVLPSVPPPETWEWFRRHGRWPKPGEA